jgi:hypothetical protein
LQYSRKSYVCLRDGPDSVAAGAVLAEGVKAHMPRSAADVSRREESNVPQNDLLLWHGVEWSGLWIREGLIRLAWRVRTSLSRSSGPPACHLPL